MKDFLLSVIIPVFNEEGNIGPLLDRLLPIVDRYNHEIIFVNDGSRDSTVADVKSYATHNKHLKLVSFQRNFGHQMALSAGYGVTKGDCVVTIDADLQDPPEIIPEMIEEWQKGAITFTEMRAILRKAGTATEDDKTAKEQISRDEAEALAITAKAMEGNAPNIGDGGDDA